MNNISWKSFLLGALAASAFFMLVIVIAAKSFLYPWFFPTKDDVQTVITEYKKESDPRRRAGMLRKMLHDVRDPGDKEQDNVSSFATGSLARLYKENKDEAILNAVDGTRIDGGFANFVCMFYDSISQEQEFVERYSQSEHFCSVQRCSGISFSPEELDRLIKLKESPRLPEPSR